MRARMVSALLLVTTLASASPRHERTIIPAGPGPNRLEVDAMLLTQSVDSLGDLRLVDHTGREVAYLLIPPRPRQPQWIDGRILPITVTKKSSGVEIDLGAIFDVDGVRLDGIAAPFLKRVRLEASGDRTRWTLLTETTVFDLPDEKLRRTEIGFAAGPYRFLRITWDDRTSAPVRTVPHAAARARSSGAPPEPLRRPLSFRRVGSEPRKSRYQIDLPAARLPIEAIEVSAVTALTALQGNVFRRAEVSEPRLTYGQIVSAALGAGTLRRAQRGDAVATDMAIVIAQPTGMQIELLVEDGDNVPLEIAEITARFTPQPWIYFESPDGKPLTARTGDPGLNTPRYDLEASRAFAAKTTLPHARWTDDAPITRPRPRNETPPPPSDGATIERSQFLVSRPVPTSQQGLTLLALDLDVLSRSRQLADVRLVDAEGRQVEFIVEDRGDPIGVRLTLPRRLQKRRMSIYRFILPYESLPPGSRLELTTGNRVFHRDVQLVAPTSNQRDQHSRTLGATVWASSSPDLDPPPLSFEVAGIGRRTVELRIDEADNAPLRLRSAELIVPGRALRFFHPSLPLTLLYGNAALGPPRYDLALLAPQLRGEQAADLTLAPVNPPEPGTSRGERRLFWIGIVVAALVLIALLARLLRESPGEDSFSRPSA